MFYSRVFFQTGSFLILLKRSIRSKPWVLEYSTISILPSNRWNINYRIKVISLTTFKILFYCLLAPIIIKKKANANPILTPLQTSSQMPDLSFLSSSKFSSISSTVCSLFSLPSGAPTNNFGSFLNDSSCLNFSLHYFLVFMCPGNLSSSYKLVSTVTVPIFSPFTEF